MSSQPPARTRVQPLLRQSEPPIGMIAAGDQNGVVGTVAGAQRDCVSIARLCGAGHRDRRKPGQTQQGHRAKLL